MSVLINDSISIYEALQNIKMASMLCLHSKGSMFGVWSR